jgi:hypothetical protein
VKRRQRNASRVSWKTTDGTLQMDVRGMYASMQVSSSSGGSGGGRGRAMEGDGVIRQGMHAHTLTHTYTLSERTRGGETSEPNNGSYSARAERETLGLLVSRRLC